MTKALKNIERPARPDAAALRELAVTLDTSIPGVMPTTGSEIVFVPRSAGLVDQLDVKAAAEGTARTVVITQVLAAAGYPLPAHDLEDRTPRRRRRAA